jgi:hypothetical protein
MAKPEELLQKDARMSLEAVLRNYRQAVEDFALGLEDSSSSYELMIAKQKYLLAASGVIKELSEICSYKRLCKAATFFEAAALAYLDESDRRAYYQGSDGRFALSEDISCFLKSRLRMWAYRAYRIWAIYSMELQSSIDLPASALEFLLDVALELPIDAWDCAPCLASGGNCKDCGYGRDHIICSHSGSTYEMLSLSRGFIIKSIRSVLSKARVQARTDREEDLYSEPPKYLFLNQEVDLCEGLDAADLCDWS